MTDSMNAERPQPNRPLIPAAEGPSIPLDNQNPADKSAETTFLARLGGQQEKLRGQAQPGAAAPAGSPRTPRSEGSQQGKNVLYVAAGAAGAAVVGLATYLGIKASAGTEQPTPDSTLPAGAVSTPTPDFEATSTAPAGFTITPEATKPAIETPVVRGPEHGHASVEQMEGVPAEVKAVLEEINKDKNKEIIGNRYLLTMDPELADREMCLEFINGDTNPVEQPCQSMSDVSLKLNRFPNALELLDAASPAAVELIRDADNGTLPYIRAYVGDTNTVENISLTAQDPNKVIISYHYSAEPDDRALMTPSSSSRITPEVYQVGEWMIFRPKVYTLGAIGNDADGNTKFALAEQMNNTLASFANAGYKKTGAEYGTASYALTTAEKQFIAKTYSPELWEYFQPGRTATSTNSTIDSIIEVEGIYHFKMLNGEDFTRKDR